MSTELTADSIPQGENPDVVIVGGGPIGLWTGIQTSILSGKKVTIIEKYNEYQKEYRQKHQKKYSKYYKEYFSDPVKGEKHRQKMREYQRKKRKQRLSLI